MAFVRRRKFNTKRKLQQNPNIDELEVLASKIDYGGNPEHKRNPGDFELTPPASPRAGKALCDDAQVFKKAEAIQLLKKGMKKGFVSEQVKSNSHFPQNIWIVKIIDEQDFVLEAQLENPTLGKYHGYPLPNNDPMKEYILQRWRREERV